MPHSFIKAGATAFALGGFALAWPAQALSPLPLNDTAALLIPVADEENARNLARFAARRDAAARRRGDGEGDAEKRRS